MTRRTTFLFRVVLPLAAGAALAFALAAIPGRGLDPLVLGVSCIVTLILARSSARISHGGPAWSPARPLVYAAFLAFGYPLACVAAGLEGLVRDLESRGKDESGGFVSWFTRVLALTIGAASYTLVLTLLDESALSSRLAATFALGAAAFLVGRVLAARAAHAGAKPTATRRRSRWALMLETGSALVGLLIAELVQSMGDAALAASVIALLVGYAIYRAFVDRVRARHNHLVELQHLHRQVMEAFALAIDARDPGSAGRARRVRAYAEEIGRVLRRERASFAGEELRAEGWLESLVAAAILQDVGKLGLPDHALAGNDRADQDRLREHVLLSERIVARLGFKRPIHKIVRHHHEHWDGSGYPEGLRGNAIPLESRVLCLADGLDEMGRSRTDGTHPSLQSLVEFVGRHAGATFDPHLAEIYCEHAEEIERRVASREQEEVFGTREEDDAGALARDAHREAGLLIELSRQLGETLDVDEIAERSLERLVELLPCNSGAIYLLDSSVGQLLPRHAAGPLKDLLLRRSFDSGEGLTGWVFQAGRPLQDGDPRVDLGRAADEGAAGCASLFPLGDDAGVIGVLALYGPAGMILESPHRHLLESALPRMSAALRNAILYQESRNTSMTDALTGLPNSRSLYAQLEKEIARATRSAKMLCVAVLDLDRFKPINDTYGHQAGDRVLQRVAREIADAFRACDHVCRYAGDEFVALLPDTSPDQGRMVVKRVQQRVRDLEIDLSTGEIVRVDVSAGLACFPIDGSSLEDLIHRADKEMYRDKAQHHELAALGAKTIQGE